VEVYTHVFLTAALYTIYLHTLAALPPEKDPPVLIMIRGWVVPSAGLDDMER
jgi:hypothetical protein